MQAKIKIFQTGPLRVNCSIVYTEKNSEALLIDPGGHAQMLLHFCEQKNLTPTMILHTHAHFDHINGTNEIFSLRPDCKAQTYLHKEDKFLWDNFGEIAAHYGIPVAKQNAKLHHFVEDGQKINFLDFTFQVIHTPGHSPGSVCYYLQNTGEDVLADDNSLFANKNEDEISFYKEEKIAKKKTHSLLFSGDTLFYNSVGRTDLWRGDQDQLLKSIKEKLYTLPERSLVIPGHERITTLKREKQKNPFTR